MINVRESTMDTKQIRTIMNKKFSFFGMSVSEFDIILKSFFIIFLISTVIQIPFTVVESSFVIYIYTVPATFLLPFILNKISKKFNPGVFFLVIKKINPIKALFLSKKTDIIKRKQVSSKRHTNLQ